MESFESSLCEIRSGKHLPEPIVTKILMKLEEILAENDNILILSSPIIICGDLHGQLFDLFEMFDTVEKNTKTEQFLFLGDYVDRGHFSLETFLYLAILKIQHPERIHLLRGNHEAESVNYCYGLYHEIMNLYHSSSLYQMLNEVFHLLSLAAIIDETHFCVHGGLSPSLHNYETLFKLERRVEIADTGIIADLVWSDPAHVEEWTPSSRGSGYLFGEKQTSKFLSQNSLKRIIRSHQVIMDGYEELFDQKVFTVWSAPNYMYRTGNKACVLLIASPLPDIPIFFNQREEKTVDEGTDPWPYFV